MADVKISGLPASTTPLAGTEVLPIVQGGVTKQVSVANLTAGRAISTSALTATTADINGGTIDGAAIGNDVRSTGKFTNADTTGTFRYGATFIIHGANLNTITQCGDYAGYGLTNGPAFVPNPAAWILVEVFNTADNILWQRATDAPFGSKQQAIRGSADGGATWLAWTYVTQFDANGNIAMPNGKGIDFSATAGTGTSELFDDYETGTWTPVITCATPGNLTIVYDSQVGTYTKVGRQVTVTFAVSTTTFTHTTASGIVFMTGLPFAPGVSGMVPFASFEGFTSAGFTQMGAQVVATVSNLYVVISGSGQTLTNAAIGTFPTGTVKKLFGTATYFV